MPQTIPPRQRYKSSPRYPPSSFRIRSITGAVCVATFCVLPLVTSAPSYNRRLGPSLAAAFIQRNYSSSSSSSSSSPVSSSPPFAIAMGKGDSPSAQRNKGPIWEALSLTVFPQILPLEIGMDEKEHQLRILEVAAGSGVHTEEFAFRLKTSLTKSFMWYPTDPTTDARESIQCYINDNPQLSDVVASPMPLTLDANGIQEASTAATLVPTLASRLDLIICINMIHISPWAATLGLMKLAGQSLSTQGCLYCYGPYKVGGTAVESNLNFDRSLKSRDPSWGVRDLESVVEAAAKEGLELKEKIEMPANNLSLIFQRRISSA